jgi:hypothetical protein
MERVKAEEEPNENDEDPTYDSRIKVFGPDADMGATSEERPALALQEPSQDDEAADEVSDTKGHAEDSEVL